MGYVGSLVGFLAIITAAHAEAYNSGLEAKIDILSAQMRQLEKQNHDIAEKNSELAKQNNELAIQNLQLKKKDSDLERKITNMQTMVDSSTDGIFDCYLTSNWEEAGPIVFSGCEGKDKSIDFI